MHVTFIGIGYMGTQMVPHLAAAGYDVVIWDKDPKKAAAIAGDHVTVADSLADAVRASKVIITSVMSSDVPALHIGSDDEKGITAYLQPGSTLIVTSTLDPEKIEAIHKTMPPDTHLLDSPIIGGVRYAREASLVLIVGGNKTIFDQVKPILSVFGTVDYVGPLGNGAKLKLITNVGIMAAEAGIRETLDLADAYGIDYDTTLDLLQRGPMKPVVVRALDETNPRPLKDSVADEIELVNATKDLVELPMAKAGLRRLEKAVDAVDGEARFSDIVHTNTSLDKNKQK
ncbi:NAD(P)-dependent oxidoreductase [Schleiferilactobacillus perolens]|jgi:3-hydroxyisobutyrate dehydrogenase-like beta-hydroxyacid dehydrogenase|uniref:NAD(P)-dependent oxidoreductase n=1 Tax=Schleiferilactobacillus perolens TaxID=100468 RepID=UPI0023570CFB|nr:NAD(P)-dependent oxidoreductase [Schleiferilactobacillus perolens]MCI2170994.1 NAD(P)-dependent oxidoreductase [Schleiferilactobacillus perolens]